MTKIQITEEQNLHKEWYEEAKNQTLETLPVFISNLVKNYSHDYDTICHAIAAAALAAARTVDKSGEGGITGFQAGCVMWSFIQEWTQKSQPLRLLDYENLLYPQYEDSFKTIKKDTWEWLQKEAKRKILENESSELGATEKVLAHWQSIVDGKIPFGLSLERS